MRDRWIDRLASRSLNQIQTLIFDTYMINNSTEYEVDMMVLVAMALLHMSAEGRPVGSVDRSDFIWFPS